MQMNIIELLTDNLLNRMSDYVSVLDNECNFIQVNHKQMNIMGYQSTGEILGKSYYQFKGISTSVAETFIDEDKLLLKKNKPLRYLSYHEYSDGKWHLLLGDKSCILDNENQVVGIFSQAKDITHDRLIDFSRFMFDQHEKYEKKPKNSGFDYIISQDDDIGGLSKKEMVVLFYFLRGKSAREIANIICRSEKTINFHLETIKDKFNVNSKSALIEKSIYNGFMNIIPKEIL